MKFLTECISGILNVLLTLGLIYCLSFIAKLIYYAAKAGWNLI